MTQRKAEAVQDYINRKVMISLSIQNDRKVRYDEKMRGYWPIRTSALQEQEITGIRIFTEGSTGLSAVRRAIQQTIVAKRREEVRDDRREQEGRARGGAGDNFRALSDGKESEFETDLEKSRRRGPVVRDR